MARQAIRQQQMNVDELRAHLSECLRASASFSQTVYHDQPIIMTGRQMRNFVPDAISAARQIAHRADMRRAASSTIFYEQARFLADYEDDFVFTGNFSHYYPTYEDMNNEQLRGYFAWRTKVRQGQIEHGSLSFAFLYAYELIHLIGVSGPLEGYKTFRAFGESYKNLDKRFARYFEIWLDDFVIYYQLDPALLRAISFSKQDAAFGVLKDPDCTDTPVLFGALCTMSSYAIEDSPFFMLHETELQRLCVHVYRAAAHHHSAKLKTTLCAKLFGRMQTEPFEPFARAVFSNPLDIDHLEYKITPYDTVYCRDAVWLRTRYAALETSVPWLSKLLETCESILRDVYDYPNTLEQSITTKYLVTEAKRRAAELVLEKRRQQERAVQIDFGKLDAIRRAAEVTCDKLIVEEEPVATMANQASCHAEATPDQALPQSILTDEEQGLVKTLLAGQSVREFEHAHACIASVLVDAINEKLYGEFCDICIDAGSNGPQIIEDYADELRSMFAKD